MTYTALRIGSTVKVVNPDTGTYDHVGTVEAIDPPGGRLPITVRFSASLVLRFAAWELAELPLDAADEAERAHEAQDWRC